MKLLAPPFLLLLGSAAGATSPPLRGSSAALDVVGGPPDVDINPQDLLKCLQSTDKDGCDTTDTSDGGHCAWCSSESLEKSFCTTPDAGEMMKQFIQDLDCDSGEALGDGGNALGGADINPQDLLKCLQSSEKDGCDATDTSDGGHCAWCSSDTLQMSFCTTPDAGEMMKQFVQDLDCDNGGADLGVADINPQDLLKCLQSSDKNGCDATDTSDGGHCAWCSSDALGMSFCTTSDAGEIMKQFVQDLDCDGGGDLNDTVEALGGTDINPQDLLKCLQSSDKDGCDATDTSDGGHCAWCLSETLAMSFCTTPDAGEMMKQFVQDLDCDSKMEIDGSLTDGIYDLVTCVQASTDEDGCRGTDMSDGEKCAWCTSDSIQADVCVTPQVGEVLKTVIPDLECSEADIVVEAVE